ncbi:hypothetical protein DFH11DRAFT_1576136 [Phellopilus nigrolimitatus]|nr:hypothetical protein DFH11DRAFT_1576136 [Phellopilus nigrolimitatus]
MPPHRPRLQPENHRTGMSLSSKSGPVRVKVCRHALNRPFHLSIAGGQSASTVIWVPSNFAGFITCAPGVRTLSFSAHFVEHVLPHARVNVPGGAPRGWAGDEIEVAASGRVVFRVWDVFAKTPEPDADGAQIQKRAGDVWRKVFGSPAATGEKCLMRTPSMSTWNWDFLIEDDEN